MSCQAKRLGMLVSGENGVLVYSAVYKVQNKHLIEQNATELFLHDFQKV
jgi:hypothetical protein